MASRVGSSKGDANCELASGVEVVVSPASNPTVVVELESRHGAKDMVHFMMRELVVAAKELVERELAATIYLDALDFASANMSRNIYVFTEAVETRRCVNAWVGRASSSARC